MLHKLLAIVTTLIVLATGAWSSAQAPTQAAAVQPSGERATAIPSDQKRRPTYPTIHVTDLHCRTCARRLARKLFTVPGVMKVQVRVKDDTVIVIPQKNKLISPLALWEAAEAAKFKIVKIETPGATFNKKPVELAQRQPDPRNAPTQD